MDSPAVQKLLSTSEFAEALGVSESSVRRLADSGHVNVHRTKGGHRKIPVEEAIRYVRDQGIRPQRPELLGVSLSTEADAPNAFFKALTDGDSDLAVRVLQTLYLEGSNAATLFDGPVLNALSRIGSTFPQDKKSIFVEHRAVIICIRSLMQLRSMMPQVAPDAPSAICAAPAGDPFLLPSLMCSLVFHEAGFSEINLGPDTPLDIVMDAIEDESPRIISLSITGAIRSKSQLAEIEKLNRAANKHDCALIIGGKNAELVESSNIQRGRSMTELFRFAKSLRHQT
ncbi:MAG: helix-turn-helix domain-containing protein [Planctomycetota bacterium]